MLASLLLLAVAVSPQDTAAALDAVKHGRLRTGIPTAGILIERGESNEPQPLVTLFRQGRLAGDGTLNMVWHARLATLGEPTRTSQVNSDQCPALTAQAQCLDDQSEDGARCTR